MSLEKALETSRKGIYHYATVPLGTEISGGQIILMTSSSPS